MSATDDELRDRELENILGQFLVTSFQSDKLAEMVYQRLAFRDQREIKLIIPARGGSKGPLALTIRVEPYGGPQPKSRTRKVGAVKAACFLESPDLDISPSRLREGIHEVVEGSLQWWIQQGTHGDLKLGEWKINTSVIGSEDSRKLNGVYTLLGNLEARRKGEAIER